MEYNTKQILNLINPKLDWGKIELPSGKIVRLSKALRTFARWGTVCAHCGRKGDRFIEEPVESTDKSKLTLFSKCGIPMTADHIIPLAKGGANHIDNLQPMCGPCNTDKDDKIEHGITILYSLRSVKEFVLANYSETERIAFVKDFHKVVLKLGTNPDDFLLRVPFDIMTQYLIYVYLVFEIDVPFQNIVKVPVRKLLEDRRIEDINLKE